MDGTDPAHLVQTGHSGALRNDRYRIRMARMTGGIGAPLEPGVIMIGNGANGRAGERGIGADPTRLAQRRTQSWIDSQPVAAFGRLVRCAPCGTSYSLSSLSCCRYRQRRNPRTRIRHDR
jgi:hypothetical protein